MFSASWYVGVITSVRTEEGYVTRRLGRGLAPRKARGQASFYFSQRS